MDEHCRAAVTPSINLCKNPHNRTNVGGRSHAYIYVYTYAETEIESGGGVGRRAIQHTHTLSLVQNVVFTRWAASSKMSPLVCHIPLQLGIKFIGSPPYGIQIPALVWPREKCVPRPFALRDQKFVTNE